MDLKQEQAEVELKQSCETCGALPSACTHGPELKTSDLSGADTMVDLPQDDQPQQNRAAELKSKIIGGRYRILELIGTGAVGSVYKVRHELLDKTYAIKLLNATVAADFKVIQRFHQEAKAVADLSHPNLISVHDFGVTEDGAPYLVMDYLEGESLHDQLDRCGHIDEQRVLSIFQSICAGLSYAHSKGIVHRDLKPSNIMMVKDDNGREVPKIVDFGIAKRQEVDIKLTQTGEVFGTPLYMSPEQCLGKEVDQRSDIYSLGCMMYECLSGIQPYEGVNAIQTIFKHIHEEVKPLRKACEGFDVSSGIEQVVSSCLEIEPDRRPPSADGLALNLQRVSSGKAPLRTGLLPKISRTPLLRAAKTATVGCLTALIALVLFFFCSSYFAPDYVKADGRAVAQFKAGQIKEALASEKRAIQLAESPGNSVPPMLLAQYHMFAGTMDADINDYPGVVDDMNQVVKYAEIAGDKRAQSEYSFSAAQYEAILDTRKALQYFKRAAVKREQFGGKNEPFLVTIFLDASKCAFKGGTPKNVQDCLPDLERAAEIAEHHPKSEINANTRADLYLQLGKFYLYLEKYPQAKEALTKAKSIAKSESVSPLVRAALNNLLNQLRTQSPPNAVPISP